MEDYQLILRNAEIARAQAVRSFFKRLFNSRPSHSYAASHS